MTEKFFSNGLPLVVQPTRYEMHIGSAVITVEARHLPGQPEKWAVCGEGYVMDFVNKEWVYEPLPSSRTDEFIRCTRFDSLDKALDAVIECFDSVVTEQANMV